MAWERERERIVRQESSGVLAFRVIVMLSCLILVPAAAIFGSAFPELVQTQLVDRLKGLATLLPQGDSSSAADPRPAVLPTTAGNPAPTWNTTEAAPAWQPAAHASQVYPATAHQVEYSESQPATAPPERAPQPPQAGTTGDHFTEIQQRLRDYGARRYALEAVGKQGEFYRFACTMPATDGQSREFAAVDRDPLQAMHQVMRDVEAWRRQANAPAAMLRR